MLLLPIHVMEAMQMVSSRIYDYLTQVFPGLLETLTSCREEIESCGSPLTDSSSQGQEILDKITGCKAAAENFITGSPLFSTIFSDCVFARVEKLLKEGTWV